MTAIDAMNSFHDAAATGDLAALTELLSEDLVYAHSNGRVESKKEVLEAMSRRNFSFKALEVAELARKDFAVLRAKLALEGSAKIFSVLYVWEVVAGDWRMLARHSTTVPEDATN